MIEVNELYSKLVSAKEALLYMLILHKAEHNQGNMERVMPALYTLQSEGWSPEKVDGIFREIFDYVEGLENGSR